MRLRRVAPVLAGLLLTACGQATTATVASPAPSASSTDSSASMPALHGSVPSQHVARPSFTLTDTSGATFDFAARTKGRVTLLYFGYTHCPDQCPTAMADIATALREVPASVRQQVMVVFVTTDPERDTPTVLRRWLDRFNPTYIGLTGTPAQVRAAQKAAQIMPATKESAAPSDHVGQYAVSHFAATLAYGRDDRLATLYPTGVTPADYAADLPVLVKG